MNDILEMTVSPSYTAQGARRLRLLKLLRVALAVCLILSWIYGVSVAAAFIQRSDGTATQWILFFGIFTIPATLLLILVHRALTRLTREYDYCLEEDILEIHASNGKSKRKLLLRVNCFTVTAFAPLSNAAEGRFKVIRAALGQNDIWALDFRDEEQRVRVLLQPNENLRKRLASYTR